MSGSDSGPLRVGLVGAGEIAGHHLTAYREHPDRVQLVAVCDISREAAQRRASEAGGVQVFTDVDEMLRTAEIDAVDICTVHDTHAPMAIAAAESGRHVLVEKPMACTLADAQRMVDVAERAGVTLMVAQTMRYEQSSLLVRDALLAGAIGRPRALRLELMLDFTRYYREGSWAYDASRAGGGVVIMTAVHLLDLARFWLGEVESVSARSWTSRPDLFVNGAEDGAVTTLQFESGVVGDLMTMGSVPGLVPGGGIWSRTALFGDEGTLSAEAVILPEAPVFPEMVLRSLTPETKDGAAVYPTRTLKAADDDPGTNPYVEEILHFEQACRTGSEPLTSGRDNLQTIRLVAAVYESARTGQPVAPGEVR
ncbi:MAG TPA: Gfo/Idh/MocA family oxidoreductase [Conexibacter sp.]|nr:Gfo/Idh/MocA family oxidoreductase [Conexibacter sp.]